MFNSKLDSIFDSRLEL